MAHPFKPLAPLGPALMMNPEHEDASHGGGGE